MSERDKIVEHGITLSLGEDDAVSSPNIERASTILAGDFIIQPGFPLALAVPTFLRSSLIENPGFQSK
jgi:hypothetical protein